MDMSPQHYIPGVCNIGGAEIRVRKRIGWAMLAVTIAVATAVLLLDVSRWWRLLVFPVAYGSAIGFIQGYAGFCAAYGLRGVLNLGPRAGRTEPVREDAARRRDRRRALRMVATATIVAIVVTVAVWIVPA